MNAPAAMRTRAPMMPRSGKAPHQLWPVSKTIAATTRAKAAGLKMLDQRVRRACLLTIANATVTTRMSQLSWGLNTKAMIMPVRTAPSGKIIGAGERRSRRHRSTAAVIAATNELDVTVMPPSRRDKRATIPAKMSSSRPFGVRTKRSRGRVAGGVRRRDAHDS